jgi:Lon-like protease
MVSGMHEDRWDVPTPPGVRPVRGSPLRRLVILLVTVVIVTFISFAVPIPMFYAYLPGPVRDVEKLIEVKGARTYSSEGSLLMTTVSVDTEVTVVDLISSAFDDTRSIVPRDAVTGGQSLDDLRRRQAEEMRDSKVEAEAVALSAIGLAAPTGEGVRVIDTVPRSPAAGEFEPGDVIVRIDGEKAQTTCDVGLLIDRRDAGDTIDITVVRDGGRKTLSLTTGPAPEDESRAFLGIVMEDIDFSFESPVTVDFPTGEIAGPSAGLMFALTLYDRLTPDDLTGGRRIAGTGTIACDGGVGAIGGVEQKVAAAERRGAEVFLAPAGNAVAARTVAGDIKVISVGTFRDALEYLEG